MNFDDSSIFSGGVGSTLKFDKEKRTISNNDGRSIRYSVLSEEQVKAIPASAAFSAARMRNALVSETNGVPSGEVTLQNIRTTLPCSGRHGKRDNVDGSGCKSRSE